MNIAELKNEIGKLDEKSLEELQDFIDEKLYEKEDFDAPPLTAEEIKKEQERMRNDPVLLADIERRLGNLLGERELTQKVS